MDDLVGATQGVFQSFRIADIGPNEFDVLRQTSWAPNPIMHRSAMHLIDQRIEYTDMIPLSEQPPREVAADKAGAARDQKLRSPKHLRLHRQRPRKPRRISIFLEEERISEHNQGSETTQNSKDRAFCHLIDINYLLIATEAVFFQRHTPKRCIDSRGCFERRIIRLPDHVTLERSRLADILERRVTSSWRRAPHRPRRLRSSRRISET